MSMAPGESGATVRVFGWLGRLIAGLPSGLGYVLADLATALHWLAFPARRRAALANLAVMLPRASRRDRARVAWRMMRSCNRMVYESLRLPHIPRGELLASVEVVGRDHLDESIARGRGAIITATHIGNWELAGVMVAQMGYALHAVASVLMTRWLSGAESDIRTRLSITPISPKGNFRKVLHALEQNHPVALMVDGNVFRRGVMVEWFGRPTPFPAGPGILAQRTGAPVIPSYCERLGPGRFRIVIEPPLDPALFATTAELHQAIAASAERQVRSHLGQWCIFRPLWTSPATEDSCAPVGEGLRVGA